MKLFLVCLLVFLLFPTGGCVRSQNAQSHKGPFFDSGGGDLDSKVRSLQRMVGYTHSKLGIAAYDFEFAIPQGKKLEATFAAELDGEIVPELSGTWHIPPSDKSDNDLGTISIYYFNAPYNDQAAQPPVWELNIQGPSGSGYTWTANSPFRPPKQGGHGASVSTSGLSSLDVDREHKVWEYSASLKTDGPSNERPYDFNYALKIKMTDLKEGEKLERITKVDSLTGR